MTVPIERYSAKWEPSKEDLEMFSIGMMAVNAALHNAMAVPPDYFDVIAGIVEWMENRAASGEGGGLSAGLANDLTESFRRVLVSYRSFVDLAHTLAPTAYELTSRDEFADWHKKMRGQQ